jgi:hypothetical protein
LVNLSIEGGELLLHLDAQLGRLVERRFESLIDNTRQALEQAQGLVEVGIDVGESAVRGIDAARSRRRPNGSLGFVTSFAVRLGRLNGGPGE